MEYIWQSQGDNVDGGVEEELDREVKVKVC